MNHMLICKEENGINCLLFPFSLLFFQWDCVLPESSIKLELSCAPLAFSVSKGCILRLPYFEQVWHFGYSVLQTEHRSVGPCSKSAIIDDSHLSLAGMPLADAD